MEFIVYKASGHLHGNYDSFSIGDRIEAKNKQNITINKTKYTDLLCRQKWEYVVNNNYNED